MQIHQVMVHGVATKMLKAFQWGIRVVVVRQKLRCWRVEGSERVLYLSLRRLGLTRTAQSSNDIPATAVAERVTPPKDGPESTAATKMVALVR